LIDLRENCGIHGDDDGGRILSEAGNDDENEKYLRWWDNE
jgi:hypothetical protein